MDNFLALQWHLTNRCNLRCKHCYHETYEGDELPLDDLKRVFHEYLDLAKAHELSPALTITGGEPFVRDDLLDFLTYISAYKDELYRCSILTNGSFLTPALLKQIQEQAPAVDGIQISLEGDEDSNDAIRGAGSFRKILQAASIVKKHSAIHIHFAATVTKLNHKKILTLADLLLTYDIPLALRRFIPIGQGADIQESLLNPTELRDFWRQARRLNEKYKKRIFLTKGPICTSSLQALDHPTESQSSCVVLDKQIITIMPNGDVYPCRLLPIRIGNVKEQSLSEMYEGPYNKFTDVTQQSNECQSCAVFGKCRGGAHCFSHAVTGDYYARDPQCWKK